MLQEKVVKPGELVIEEVPRPVPKPDEVLLNIHRIGICGSVPKVDLAMVGNNELQLIGCLMYKREEFLEAIRLVKEKKSKLTPLITHRFPFEKYAKAYSIFEKSTQVMKVMIEL